VHLPCEVAAKFILPVFRSYVAKDLVEKYSFTQLEVAEKLGITQAAISQYLHSKRGHKGRREFDVFLPMIQSAAGETARNIAAEKTDVDEVMTRFCKLCLLLREEGRMLK